MKQIDAGKSGSDVSKSINVLDAITWTKEAMKSITKETVRNCFKKAGFPITTDDNENLSDDVIKILNSYESYITIDDCLQTEDRSMEIRDILDDLRAPLEEDEEDDDQITDTENPYIARGYQLFRFAETLFYKQKHG